MNNKIKLILLFLLSIFIYSLSSCNIDENEPEYLDKSLYETSVKQEDCYLCGSNSDSPFSHYWGQANIGLLNLNTMEIFVFEVNKYDKNGLLIPKIERYSSHSGYLWHSKAGSTVQYSYNTSRGFIDMSISMNENSALNINNLTRNYCTDCLSKIINEYLYKNEQWDVALVDFQGKEIRPLDKDITGFSISDYRINCEYNQEYNSFNVYASYSPIRYSELAYNPDETVMEQIMNQCAEKNITLILDNELTKFIESLEEIDGLSINEEFIEFQSGFKFLYVFSDGTYDIFE